MSDAHTDRYAKSVVTACSALIFLVLVANLAGGADAIPAGIANLLRLISVALPLSLVLFLYSRKATLKGFPSLWLHLAAVFALMVISLFSVVHNQPGFEGLMHALLNAIHMLNVLVIWPCLFVSFLDRRGLKKISSAYLVFAFAIAVLALVLYFLGLSPFTRVGYPLIPGVYAYLMLIAFVLSLHEKKSPLIAAMFAVFLVLGGSRSAVFMAFLVASLSFARGLKWQLLAIIFLLGSGLYLFLFGDGIKEIELLRPFFLERDDFSSGRYDLWAVSIDIISRSYWLGNGAQVLIDAGLTEDLVAHNAYLDLALTYGIPYAVVASLVWVKLGVQAIRQGARHEFGVLIISLIAVVQFKSMVTNIFWTNVADGVTYITTLYIVVLAVSPNVAKFRHEN